MKKLMRNKKYTIPGIYFEIAKVSPVKFAVQYIITIAGYCRLILNTPQHWSKNRPQAE